MCWARDMENGQRFTVCTYNLWTSTRWDDRAAAVAAFAGLHRPDVWCVQELTEPSRSTIDRTIGASHDRVVDDFIGWAVEGNIWWNRALFDLVEFGAEQIGILEEHRRLFWVRLSYRESSAAGRTLLVSTAHYTWSGHEIAVAQRRNVRMDQADATVAALARLGRAGEAVMFMGDLNDAAQPIQILRESGLVDCFAALGRWTRATYPAAPTGQGSENSIDWLMHRGPVRAMSAEVIDFWLGDVAPSDHKPVLATFAAI